jgi:predicted adenylyl cyclase CyaB
LTTETEVKVKIEDVGDFCRRLGTLNPGTLSARHFEDNHLLDFPDRRLGTSQCLLRIRFADSRHFLTFKGPPRPNGIFKTREELETALEDGSILLQTLERIGMSVSFRYQKYRQEFAFGEVHVAVDETPIGNYAEFEGSETGIRELAHKMGIDESRFLRSSYYSLYLDYCREENTTPGFMVFECEP